MIASTQHQSLLFFLPLAQQVALLKDDLLDAVDPLLCDCLSVNVVSSGYGSQLVAELFGCGCQTCDAVLSIAVFVCGCTFVHVWLAPSQQSVDKSSQLPGGSEDSDVSAAALRDSSIVRSQGRLAVA